MKAIGIDLWIDQQEVRKGQFRPSDKQDELRSQEQLRAELGKLGERLQLDGWQILSCSNDRIRVLATDDQVNALYDRIVEMLPGSDLLSQSGNHIRYRSVPEGTPIDELPSWDENRWCGIKDFSQFHPAEDELLALVRHWTKAMLEFDWEIEMLGGGMNWRDNRRYTYRPEARIGRIAKLLGKEAVEKAIKEGNQEFRKEIDNDSAYEIFLHGDHSQKEAYGETFWSSRERERERCDAAVKRYTK